MVVWLADDDEVTTRVMASLLRRWGAEPRRFEHGGELVSALEAVLSQVPNGELGADCMTAGHAGADGNGILRVGSGSGTDDGEGSIVAAGSPDATPGPAGHVATVSAATHDASELGGVPEDKGSPASRWLADALTTTRLGRRKLPTLPDVILLDGTMPVMGGLETLRALRAMRPRCPAGWQPRLLMVTGDGSPGAEAEALGAGADALLLKPVAPASLLDAILEDVRGQDSA